jgi:hypothetical protein
VGSLTDYFGRHKNVPEILKSQRYATRPALAKLFEGSILSDRAKRNRRIREAVEKYGYTQRAVADYLGFHFTYVSRILNER